MAKLPPGWTPMRASLLNHGNVLGMAEYLVNDVEFRAWVLPRGGTAKVPVAVARHLVISGLLQVWDKGNDQTGDGFFPRLSCASLDSMAGIPSFGAAMRHVEWAIEQNDGVLLPRFEERNNTKHAGSADRMRRKRERDREKERHQDLTYDEIDPESDVTSSVTTVTSDASHPVTKRNQTVDGRRYGSSPKDPATKKHSSGTVEGHRDASHVTSQPSPSGTADCISPELWPEFLTEIRSFTGETDCDDMYRRVLGTLSRAEFFEAFAEARQAARGNIRKSRGAIFMSRAKDHATKAGKVIPIGEHAPKKASVA